MFRYLLGYLYFVHRLLTELRQATATYYVAYSGLLLKR
jgi:hypothetical protein